MLSNNLLDNFPVFVEFNQSYKLLLVSCLLDQKKNFSKDETYLVWIKLTERNGTIHLFWNSKKNEKAETQNPLFGLC